MVFINFDAELIILLKIMDGVRIDKFVWCVRIYKTRSLASQMVRTGKVKLADQEVKPSREVREGDIIEAQQGPLHRKMRIIKLLKNRVGAKLVDAYIEDLTSPEEYERVEMLHEYNSGQRDRGQGRPTKRDRRDIERLTKF